MRGKKTAVSWTSVPFSDKRQPAVHLCLRLLLRHPGDDRGGGCRLRQVSVTLGRVTWSGVFQIRQLLYSLFWLLYSELQHLTPSVLTPRKERHRCLQSLLCKTVCYFNGMFKSCSLKLNILYLELFSWNICVKFQGSARGHQRQRPPGLRQADAADHRAELQVERGGWVCCSLIGPDQARCCPLIGGRLTMPYNTR